MEARKQMPGADEAAEQAMAIEVRPEVADAPAPEAIARVPVLARGIIEVGPQERAIGVDVVAPIGFGKKATEGAVVRQVGERDGNLVRILAGIPADAVLATDHLQDLYDGQSVKPSGTPDAGGA